MWGLLWFVMSEALYDPHPIPYLDAKIAASSISPFEPCYSTYSETDVDRLAELEFAIAAYITLVRDLLFIDPMHKDWGIKTTEIRSVTTKLMKQINAPLCRHSPWHNIDAPLKVR